jgi:hypothetical protein
MEILKGAAMGELKTKKERKLAGRLDKIYERHDAIMKNIGKLSTEWIALRKEQEAILKKLGWW